MERIYVSTWLQGYIWIFAGAIATLSSVLSLCFSLSFPPSLASHLALLYDRNTRGALSRDSTLGERGELKTSNLRDTKAFAHKSVKINRAALLLLINLHHWRTLL